IIVRQEDIGKNTNFSIKITLDELDERFDYYKVVVAQLTEDSDNINVYEEGIHTINDKTILYSGEQNKKSVQLSDINKKRLFVERVEFVTETNDSLVLGGITPKKEVNLQPVVNLMG